MKTKNNIPIGIIPFTKQLNYKDKTELDTRIPNWKILRTEKLELKKKKLSNHLNNLIQKNKNLCSYADTCHPMAFNFEKHARATDTICIKNGLFWIYNGRLECSWYLCGDGSTDAMRKAHIQWCLKYGFNTILLNLNNEELMSLFKPKKWMQVWDDARVNVVVNFIEQIKTAGLIPAIVFYDGPEDRNGKYYPILSCSDDLHATFIEIVCNALNPYTIIYTIGCETNRYWSTERVEAFIWYTKNLAGPDRFVGTHEQSAIFKNGKWVMARIIPRNAQYHCYETTNHPANGDSRSPADMATEIRFVVSNSGGIPVWVGEHNTNILGATSIAQARAMATVEGVYGMNGPM